MDFFGMGFGEILLILVIALIFVGPHKIVGIGRSLGKILYDIRKASSEMTTQITKEIDEDTKQIKETAAKVSSDLRESKKLASGTAAQVAEGIKQPGQEATALTAKIAGDIKKP